MSNPIIDGVTTIETNDETHSLTDQELQDVNSAGSSLGTHVTSEEVVRQIKAATDPLSKQIKQQCDLMRELHQASAKRNEETGGLIQSSSKAPNLRSDRGTSILILRKRFSCHDGNYVSPDEIRDKEL